MTGCRDHCRFMDITKSRHTARSRGYKRCTTCSLYIRLDDPEKVRCECCRRVLRAQTEPKHKKDILNAVKKDILNAV